MWSNTRVDGFASCYVPFHGGALRVEATFDDVKNEGLLPFIVKDGFFSFDIPMPFDGTPRHSKAFFPESSGVVYAFVDGMLLTKRVSPTAKSLVHPTHSAVELFQHVSGTASCIAELEFHGPFTTLAPGQEVSMNETWILRRYEGAGDPAGQRQSLKPLTLSTGD